MAINIARLLGREAAPVRTTVFEDGEKQIQLPVAVSGKEVILFQAATVNPDGAVFETLRIVEAAKNSGAKSITVIFPCCPYARQDRELHGGCDIPPRLIAKLLRMVGADRLITVDLHAPKQAEQFALPTYNLSTEALFTDYLRRQALRLDEVLLFAPDHGALSRARSIANTLGCDFGWVNKQRLSDGTLKFLDFHGNVRGKCVYITDDRVDTGNTLTSVTAHLKRAGARRVIGMVTHGINFSTVLMRLKTAGLDGIVETDTRNAIWHKPFTDILSVANLLADGVKNS